jgi:hypothetical protein
VSWYVTNVERDAHDVDQGAHVQRPDPVVVLPCREISKRVLFRLGKCRRAAGDRSNSLIDSALERENVNLDIVIVRVHICSLAQYAIRSQRIVPRLTLSFIRTRVEGHSAETSTRAAQRALARCEQFHLLFEGDGLHSRILNLAR